MSALNKVRDRVDRSYPTFEAATLLLEVVLYKWTPHYKCMWEAPTLILIDITM
jgi:hypothetical protein